MSNPSALNVRQPGWKRALWFAGIILVVAVAAQIVISVVFYGKFLAVPRFAPAPAPLTWAVEQARATLMLSESVAMDFVPFDRGPAGGRSTWIGTHEVMTEQYAAFVTATQYRTVAEREGFGWVRTDAGEFVRAPNVNWSNYRADLTPRTAVGMIAWVDAQAFAAWASVQSGRLVRLPSSAEWQRACAAGAYDTVPAALAARAWFRANATRTQESGLKQPDALGVYDLLGNVWEWHDNRPTGWGWLTAGAERPLGGGSWVNGPSMLRCDGDLVTEDARIREPHIGFRVMVEG